MRHAALLLALLSCRVLAIELPEPDRVLLDTMNRGQKLPFVLEYQLEAEPRPTRQAYRLGYSTLSRRWQLADAQGRQRGYTLLESALAALAAEAPTGARLRLRLDRARLPTPLQTEALLDARWRYDSGWLQP